MNHEEYGDLYSRKEEALTTRSIRLELKFNSKEDFVLMVFIFEITEIHESQHIKCKTQAISLRDWKYDCIIVTSKKGMLSLGGQSNEMEKAMFLKIVLPSYIIMMKNLWQGTNSQY